VLVDIGNGQVSLLRVEIKDNPFTQCILFFGQEHLYLFYTYLLLQPEFELQPQNLQKSRSKNFTCLVKVGLLFTPRFFLAPWLRMRVAR
jgi:hypothetical protein